MGEAVSVSARSVRASLSEDGGAPRRGPILPLVLVSFSVIFGFSPYQLMSFIKRIRGFNGSYDPHFILFKLD